MLTNQHISYPAYVWYIAAPTEIPRLAPRPYNYGRRLDSSFASNVVIACSPMRLIVIDDRAAMDEQVVASDNLPLVSQSFLARMRVV